MILETCGMGEDRNKSDASFWTTVVVITVGLVLAYPLSLGPVAWILNRIEMPEWVMTALVIFYMPLQRLCEVSEPAKTAILWYEALWLP